MAEYPTKHWLLHQHNQKEEMLSKKREREKRVRKKERVKKYSNGSMHHHHHATTTKVHPQPNTRKIKKKPVQKREAEVMRARRSVSGFDVVV